MSKQPKANPSHELLFIMTCLGILLINAFQSVMQMEFTMIGASLLIIVAVLLLLLKRRVMVAWNGAIQALSGGEVVTLAALDQEIASAGPAHTEN